MESRRKFLIEIGTFGLSVGFSTALRAQTKHHNKFDLIVKGGQVIDPSQALGANRDIGIRHGLVAAVEGNIPAEHARSAVIDATGKIVTPGLIDLHTHIWPHGNILGVPADHLVATQGTTTLVSAGDVGANSFAAFRRDVIAQAHARIYAYINLATIGLTGFPVPELVNLDFAQVDRAARVIAENNDVVLGIKVRMSDNNIAKHGLEPLKRAIEACELSGTSANVMCHIGGQETGHLTGQILDVLRPGDILTHCYTGNANLRRRATNLIQGGKLLPAALYAKQRGVVFDVAHGGGSFDFRVADAAIQQGLLPDTISSDVHTYSSHSRGMPFSPTCLG